MEKFAVVVLTPFLANQTLLFLKVEVLKVAIMVIINIMLRLIMNLNYKIFNFTKYSLLLRWSIFRVDYIKSGFTTILQVG